MAFSRSQLLTLALFGFTCTAFAADDKKDASASGPNAPPSHVVVPNSKYDDIALFGRVINFIEKQYVDKVNTRDLVYGAIKGML